MLHQFGGFELDEERRELRLRGREVVLQRKVFDLLAFLVTHRDRVVSKEELLSSLWPDVTVDEGALQRAVSLARTALRQGGMPDPIRTFTRLGYRFIGAVTEREPRAGEVPGTLVRARRASEAGAWGEAASAFSAADRESPLEGPDLERWAIAAQNLGAAADAANALERAVTANAAAGDRRGAARAAILLANLHLERREAAVAAGWRQRATRFLDGEEDCSEAGLLAWIRSRFALFEGDLQAAEREAAAALAIGRRLEDPDVEAVGLLYRGLALLALGNVVDGVALQDEAAAAVLTGDVSSMIGGTVYCGVIWACLNRADWDRAAQWTEHFNRWNERSGILSFPGLCKVHRAEVLTIRGELGAAEREIERAAELVAGAMPWAEGDALRVLGEVRLARGDLDGADEAFRRAYELGWDAQPGRALVQLARGKADAALRSLERSLATTAWATQQRRGMLLCHLVVVAVGAGQLDAARRALAELDENPELWSTRALEAMVERGRGELAFAADDRARAITHLRRAVELWHEIGSPIQVAGLRLRLAVVVAADDDLDTAELEIAAAEALYRRTQVSALEARCAELRQALGLRSG